MLRARTLHLAPRRTVHPPVRTGYRERERGRREREKEETERGVTIGRVDRRGIFAGFSTTTLPRRATDECKRVY